MGEMRKLTEGELEDGQKNENDSKSLTKNQPISYRVGQREIESEGTL